MQETVPPERWPYLEGSVAALGSRRRRGRVPVRRGLPRAVTPWAATDPAVRRGVSGAAGHELFPGLRSLTRELSPWLGKGNLSACALPGAAGGSRAPEPVLVDAPLSEGFE